MMKSGIDQDALIKMFTEASAKQGDMLRKAVSEATLKALQGRELTVENMRKVLKTITQAASAGAAANLAPQVDVEAMLTQAFAGMDAALLQAVEANRKALEQFVDRGADLQDKQMKAALANVEKMEDAFFAAVTKATQSGSLEGAWGNVLDATRAKGTETGARATAVRACAPVSVPFIFIAPSALSHGPCNGPAAWVALLTAAKNTSSIFSTFARASFICFSCSPAPCWTNWASALRFASTACSSAASIPARACLSMPSRSTPLAGFCAAPVDAAWVTLFTTLRMFSSVSSRPCSAFSVASETALRSASPCFALASANIDISASWSIPDFIMMVPCGGCRRPGRSRHRPPGLTACAVRR